MQVIEESGMVLVSMSNTTRVEHHTHLQSEVSVPCMFLFEVVTHLASLSSYLLIKHVLQPILC